MSKVLHLGFYRTTPIALINEKCLLLSVPCEHNFTEIAQYLEPCGRIINKQD